MNDRFSEIFLLEAQICVLSDLLLHWSFDSLEDLEGHIEYLVNDLEQIKTEVLGSELKKAMPALVKVQSTAQTTSIISQTNLFKKADVC